jgi:hypothetical protein
MGCCTAAGAALAVPAAQDKPAPDKQAAPGAAGDQQKMMEEMMKMMAPGPEHQRLQPLMGSFACETTSFMNPQGPEKSKASQDVTWILGGRFLMSKYSGTAAGMPFEGVGMDGYDKMKKMYVGNWYDTMGTGILSYEGSMDAAGKVLTMKGTYDDPMTGDKNPVKMVTTIVDPNKHSFEMFTTMNGQEMKMMEMTCSRK